MTNSPHVFESTAENLPRPVLENSGKGPVLVYYWSPGAGACMMLMPRLQRLAGEFGGRFLIARRDRTFRQDAGRHGLLALFEMPGNDDLRVARYRAALNETPQ